MGKIEVRKVFEFNFGEEQANLKKLVAHYNYISLHARVVPLPAAPIAASSSSAAASSSSATPSSSSSTAAASSSSAPPTQDEKYARFRQRFNSVTLIQLGFTLCNERGFIAKHPKNGHRTIWEFNVKVAMSMEEIDPSLRQHFKEHGLDVDSNMKEGIPPDVLCRELFNTEIMLMQPSINWMVFGAGAAFSPIIKIMSREKQLPEQVGEFLYEVKFYFRKFVEVRRLMAFCGLSGTAKEVAEVLGVSVPKEEAEVLQGIGAGEDDRAWRNSLLTLELFSTIHDKYFQWVIPEELENSILFFTS